MPPERERDPAIVLASYRGRTINHFTDIAGVEGIIHLSGTILLPGIPIVLPEASFGIGSNAYMATHPGDIFVTDIAVAASSGQLDQLGIFGSKQEYVISMDERAMSIQGIRIIWTNPARGISTIPGRTLVRGPLVVIRRTIQ